MKPTCPVLAFAVLSLTLCAQAQLTTVTLFNIIAPTPGPIANPNSVSYSVLGTNSEGATSYLEVIAESVVPVVLDASTTEFSTVSPTNLVYTIVADESGITWDKAASGSSDFGLEEACTWGSDGVGECVQKVRFPGETTTAPAVTISGTKFAFVTLTESIPTSITPTTTQSTTANSAFSLRSCAKDVTGMVFIAALVGCLLVF